MLPVNNITALAFCIAWSDTVTVEAGEQLGAAGVNIISSLLLSSHVVCAFLNGDHDVWPTERDKRIKTACVRR